MFCPKCRKTKVLSEETHSSWKRPRASSGPHCTDCGTLLCTDRLASEFYKSGYKPNAAVHGHKLDGLLSVSRLLIETRADSNSAEQTQNRNAGTENNSRSPFSTVITSHDEMGTGQNYAERVGRYDNLQALDGSDPEPESTQYSGLIHSKPSPWPVIAIVVAMEILISFGVYAIHGKVATSHSTTAVHAQVKSPDPIRVSLVQQAPVLGPSKNQPRLLVRRPSSQQPSARTTRG